MSLLQIDAMELSAQALRRYALIAGVVWTVILGFSLVSDLSLHRWYAELAAREIAEAHLHEADALVRWAGALFRPAGSDSSEFQAAEPGIAEILKGTAERLSDPFGTRVRLVSLQPTPPWQSPDSWERSALGALEAGAPSASALVEADTGSILRVMWPLREGSACLSCPQQPEKGALLGGISVGVPLGGLLAAGQRHDIQTALLHALYWLLGIGTIVWVARRALAQLAERERVEVEVRRAYRFHRSVVGALGEGLYGVDVEGRLTFLNPEGERLLGWKESELAGKVVHDVIHSERADGTPLPAAECPMLGVLRTGQPYRSDEVFFIGKEGERIPVGVISTPIEEGGRVIGSVIAFQNVSERKRGQERIEYLAHHDELTGLPNRSMLMAFVDQQLAEARRYHGALALLFIDLDAFSGVNNTYGHLAGDELLREVAQRLRQVIREPDILARQGGDEFIVLLTQLTQVGFVEGQAPSMLATGVAERLLGAFQEPFRPGGHSCQVGASIGISIFPEDAMDAGSLMRNADTAMYQAKENGGRRYALYDRELSARLRRERELELRLRRAVERGELELYYQPIVLLATGTLVGLEALLRWELPGQGVVAPGELLPIAERTGTIVAIGQWTLSRACCQAARWQGLGHSLYVSVNLCARQLVEAEFEELAREAVRSSGVAAERIELELAESDLQRLEPALGTLRELRRMGFRLALDDFGAGYSFLRRLGEIPFHTLKIDRALIGALSEGGERAQVVLSTIQLAQNLGMSPLAECVETEEQCRLLRQLGCELAQGDFFCPPLPAERIDALLRMGELELPQALRMLAE